MASRRGVIRMMAGGAAGLAIVGTSQASTTELTGRLVSYDGTPIDIGRVYVDGSYYQLDSDGRFTATVESDTSARLALYKGEDSLLAPVRNGVPHIYGLDDYQTGSDGRDVGTITVPRGYLVQLRALDEEGTPVTDATPHVRHEGYGSGYSSLTTDQDGYMKIAGTEFNGLELRGSVDITMKIPQDDPGSTTFEKQVSIDSPKTIIFQVGEGVRMIDSSEGTATPTPSPSATPTQTPSPSPTATPRETDAPTATATSTPTAERQRTEMTATPGSSQSPSATASTQTRTPRGFISNGSGDDLAFLSNPFALTIGGFVVSVAGVLHQMLRGA